MTRTAWIPGLTHPAIIDEVMSNGPCARVQTTKNGTRPARKGDFIVEGDDGEIWVEYADGTDSKTEVMPA